VTYKETLLFSHNFDTLFFFFLEQALAEAQRNAECAASTVNSGPYFIMTVMSSFLGLLKSAS
jgi:hypothetical protein